jgi:NADPH:quinone reductase
VKAIVVERHGGPEVLSVKDVAKPEPGPGEVRIRIHAAGVNFIEIYHRTGAYTSTLPYTPGSEAAGVVEQVGPGVSGLRVGDAVASTSVRGSYAEAALVAADRVVPVPTGIPIDVAAGALLQGMTAHYLTHSTYALKRDDWCLVHAAAGGVGQLLVRFAKQIGAHVIATVSSQEKAAIARACGADHILVYGNEDFSADVKRLTGGPGVHVVYDGVGVATYERSLASLRPRGMLALFGSASGPVLALPVPVIQKGSLFVTRPSLMAYVATREDLLWRAKDVFSGAQAGWLPVHIDRVFPLAEAADAHRYLGDRRTKGKLLLRADGKGKA